MHCLWAVGSAKVNLARHQLAKSLLRSNGRVGYFQSGIQTPVIAKPLGIDREGESSACSFQESGRLGQRSSAWAHLDLIQGAREFAHNLGRKISRYVSRCFRRRGEVR